MYTGDRMNRKGFTLIELLAVIILIAIVSVIVVPSVLNSVEKSKEASYNMLIKNIITASELYYQECEYGDLSNEKYGIYACGISNNEINTSLGALANTGMLKVNDLDAEDKKIVINPKTNDNISDCKIKITKNKNATTGKITYTVTGTTAIGVNCPAEYQGE